MPSFQDIISQIINAIISIFIKPQPKPPPPVPNDFSNILLQLHNQHRQSLGLSPLNLNPLLEDAAQKHSNWMYKNNTLNHFENGRGPGDRISSEGYRWNAYGENIAEGYQTPQSVFQGWLSSSGHRANIENPSFKDVGFGVTGTFWTTDFASKFGNAFIGLPGGIKFGVK